jgi:hypothetical protein
LTLQRCLIVVLVILVVLSARIVCNNKNEID